MSDTLIANKKDGPAIPVRFARLYTILLVVLTLLLTVGQGLTQWRLGAVQDEIWIIRYASMQRHQSQQIVKQALQLADVNEQDRFAATVAELRQVFHTFERYHLQSREGRVYEHNVAIPNSDTIQRLYDGIRSKFNAFQRSACSLMMLRQPQDIARPDVQANLKLLLANEKPFLEEMDRIVREYTNELRAKLELLQAIEFYLYVLTVLVLAGVGLLIFRPAVRRLRTTFAQLIEAESRTTAANRKLLSLNKSLKETRQQLFEATKEQYQRQIDEQKMQTSYLIAGQEEERKRLSRELHDGLGQMLTAIKLQIEGLEVGLSRMVPTDRNGKVAYPQNLHVLKRLVTQTIQETRTISNNLMPSVLSDFGVVSAIKMLVENNRSETVAVTFETNLLTDGPRFDKNIEIMLYRVAQEAVSNAVRHADPSHIQIELTDRGDSLRLYITDDGRGFQMPRRQLVDGQVKSDEINFSDRSTTAPSRPPSQGLHNMQERVKLLNGKFKIYSTPGKGTRIQINMPHQVHSAYHDSY